MMLIINSDADDDNNNNKNQGAICRGGWGAVMGSIYPYLIIFIPPQKQTKKT